MKKITLFIFLLAASLGFAQTEILNLSFDAAPLSAKWTKEQAAGTTEGSLNWDANGKTTGALKMSGLVDQTANGGVGRAFIFQYTDGAFDFGNSASLSVSFDVKIDQPLSNCNLGFQTQVSKIGGGVTVANYNDIQNAVTVGGGWTTLTLNMTPNPAEFNTNGNLLIMFFNLGSAPIDGSGGTVLIDNVVITASAPTCSDGAKNGDETGIDCGGSCGPCAPTGPQSAAPTPSQASANVISIFSQITNTPNPLTSHYMDVAGTNFNPNWGSTSGNVTIEDSNGIGDLVLKYPVLDYQGTLIAGDGGSIDVSSMTYLHFDFWTDNGTSLRINVISTTTGEHPYDVDSALGTLPKGQWVGVDVPLSYLTDINPTYNFVIKELKFDQGLNKDFYFDNIFFTTEATAGVKDFKIAGLNVYPNPSKNSWTVKTSNIKMSTIKVYDILGKNVLSLTPNATEAAINGSSLKAGLYFAQIKTAGGVSSIKLVKE